MFKMFYQNTDHNCFTGYFLNFENDTGNLRSQQLNVNLCSHTIRIIEKDVHRYLLPLRDEALSYNNVKAHSHQAKAKTKNLFDILNFFSDLFAVSFDLFRFRVRLFVRFPSV